MWCNQGGGAHTVVSVHIVKLFMALAAAHASVRLLLISVLHFSTGAPAVLPHVSLDWSSQCQCVDGYCHEEDLQDVALCLHFTLGSLCCKSQMMSWRFLLTLSCFRRQALIHQGIPGSWALIINIFHLYGS